MEEVEQVRKALNLNQENFFLLGHSWGGILAMEYALKYQENLKGVIISNMMSSCPEYDKYAENVLALKLDPASLDTIRQIELKGDFSDPAYMRILMEQFYPQFAIRMPVDQWPEPFVRSMSKMNQSLYVTMQGPSEFGISGKLEIWDVSARLGEIKVPALVVGATHDTMDPEHMQWMAGQLPKGKFLLCSGGHMSMWDDQETYMNGLIDFLKAHQ